MNRILTSLRQTYRARPLRIGFPEHSDPRVREACRILREDGIIQPVEVDTKLVHDVLPGEVINKILSEKDCPMWTSLGNGLVHHGYLDGLVAGAVTSSAKVARSAIRQLGLQPGIKTLSSCFLMLAPPSLPVHKQTPNHFIFADCGVVIEPSAQQLADIALMSAKSCELLLNEQPRLAFCSFSTKGSAKHSKVDLVNEGMHIFSKSAPSNILFDGELQIDAALVRDVLLQKAPQSPLLRDLDDDRTPANVLIFPDLNTGNMAYKLVQRLAGYEALGPIFQGLKYPCNDLSRGCSVQDVVNVAYITALQCTGPRPHEWGIGG